MLGGAHPIIGTVPALLSTYSTSRSKRGWPGFQPLEAVFAVVGVIATGIAWRLLAAAMTRPRDRSRLVASGLDAAVALGVHLG